jgi:hypothetical protein
MALRYTLIHEDWWGKRHVASRHRTMATAEKAARRLINKRKGKARRGIVRDNQSLRIVFSVTGKKDQ